MTYNGRRDRVIRAAVTVAARLGLSSVAPVILRDSNHTSIHLVPFPVVARVARWTVGSGATDKLSAELAVAEHLARTDGPITTPTVDVPAGPHLEGDWAMTLWQFVAHRPAKDSDALLAVKAPREVHRALASYPGQLPSFQAAVDHVSTCCKTRRPCLRLRRRTKCFLSRNTSACGNCWSRRP
jgi:hypothetical protein